VTADTHGDCGLADWPRARSKAIFIHGCDCCIGRGPVTLGADDGLAISIAVPANNLVLHIATGSDIYDVVCGQVRVDGNDRWERLEC
jgi:hypothetical protein